MDKNSMKNSVGNDNRKTEFNNEKKDKIEKIADAPVWNEDLQKIVVGYH